MKRIPFQEAAARYPKGDPEGAGKLLASRLEKSGRKLVVLDDDPTGIQTVHDVSVYTDWSQESIDAGLQEENRTFFILTNSRSFSFDTKFLNPADFIVDFRPFSGNNHIQIVAAFQ